MDVHTNITNFIASTQNYSRTLPRDTASLWRRLWILSSHRTVGMMTWIMITAVTKKKWTRKNWLEGKEHLE